MRYSNIQKILSELEKRVSYSRSRPNRVRENYTPVQGFGLHHRWKKDDDDLPVVIAIGINYTQGSIKCPRDKHGNGGVEEGLNSYYRTRTAFQYYRKNPNEWVNTNNASSISIPLPLDNDPAFHFVITNFCLWVTEEKWLDLDPDDREKLLCENADFDGKRSEQHEWPHLLALLSHFSSSSTIWIGHGLKSQVSTLFREFQHKQKFEHWLITPNLSSKYDQFYERKCFPRDLTLTSKKPLG